MTSKKQTVSYLRSRFAEIGFRPYARHGQNFLIDLNILDVITRDADLQPNDVVLEVGMGTGSLTVRLAEVAAHVVTVEIDPHLAQLGLEQFEYDAPVTLLQHDVLDHLITGDTPFEQMPETMSRILSNGDDTLCHRIKY